MDETREVACIHCGETVTVRIDLGGGRLQSYVEDCEVCCRPWRVTVDLAGDEPQVSLEPTE